MGDSTGKTCPSSRCKTGAQLLGVRQDDGKVAILPLPLPIDDSFIEKVKQHAHAPEERFRFSNKCIESGCGQWNGKGCGVAERMQTYLHLISPDDQLPSCAIRSTCRWFFQKRADACRICPYVITEISVEQMEAAMQTD